ncbi:MAG: sigma 54-interacting transcriptional regulator [Planctomycetes bacterium]|nr:sigma 54-interacting transcriptional regulator [Planctomycetota bacterium]
MNTSKTIRRILRAVTDSDDFGIGTIRECLETTDFDPATERCVRLLAEMISTHTEHKTGVELDALYQGIDQVLRGPPASADLHLAFLIKAAVYSDEISRPVDAERLLGMAQGLITHRTSACLVRSHLLAQLSHADHACRHEEALRIWEELSRRVRRGSRLWIRGKYHVVNVRRGLADYANAFQDLDDAGGAATVGSRYHKLIILVDEGRLGEARASAEDLLAFKKISEFGAVLIEGILWAYLKTLAALGLTELGHSVLGEYRATVSPEFATVTEALLAVADGDLATARRLVAGLSDAPIPCSSLIQRMQLSVAAHLELSSGNARAARALIERLPRMPHYADFDGRLALLEGRTPEAMRIFRDFCAKAGAPALTARLVYAHELSRAAIAGIVNGLIEPPNEVGRSPTPDAELKARPATGAVRFVGSSAASRALRAEIAALAPLDVTVLIRGETGTGKEVASRLLHDIGPRAAEPFVAVNCGCISELLMESELFGHTKGAFTGANQTRRGLFETAGAGTVLLDEIQVMPPRLQAGLLRVLETREIRPLGSDRTHRIKARIVAATNQDLDAAAAEGRFRTDLLYRLAQCEVRIPPLRERPEDSADLFLHFLAEYYDPAQLVVDPALLEAVRRWPWPGNARELRNVVGRIALRAGKVGYLNADLFGLCVPGAREMASPVTPQAETAPPPNPPFRIAPAAVAATVPLVERPGPGMLSPRHTHSRRKALRRLFAEHGTLTRAEIIRLVGCAPDTATRDLKALEAEGVIRRVETSAHLRTSYFVRVGSGQASQTPG